MRSHVVSGLLVMSMAASAGVAHAQDPMAPPPATEPAPVTTTGGLPELGSITLMQGKIWIAAPLAINMSSDRVAKPLSIPLDVYYGVNDKLTLGLTHSGGTHQVAGFYIPRLGVCPVGKDNGCEKVYNNLGIDALYKLLEGTIQVAGHGGLDIMSLDPMMLSLRVGALVQMPLASRLALIADPRLWIGLTKRDEGNKEVLFVPLAVQYWVNEQIRVAGRTVLGGPLDGFGDAWFGSFGAFGAFAINEMIEAFAAFDFVNLYGKGGDADGRTLTVGANIRL